MMKTHTFDEVKDELIGKIGTPERDRFEYELQMDLIGKEINKKSINNEKSGRNNWEFN